MSSSTMFMLVGLPASTKSTYAYNLKKQHQNSVIISRDKSGGDYTSLALEIDTALKNGSTVILDNTNVSKEDRKQFIDVAKANGVNVEAIYMNTTAEDCQIRVLTRMWQKHGKVYLTGKAPFKDTHVFPVGVLFSMRKKLVVPQLDEGFSKITVVDVPAPSWNDKLYKKKALFLDIDGTLRKTDHLPNKYPTEPEEVELIHDFDKMRKKLDTYRSQGFMLFGVSNQSGIHKKTVSEKQVQECFERTRDLLGYTAEEFPILYCPHVSAPVQCYCRKPQVGMALSKILEYKLNPARCVMVGDMKTDETMAERLRMKFVYADKFWSY